MKFWLVNHSWESFKATREYGGFLSESERNKISVGDKIVYYGQGLVFGLFAVVGLPNNEYKGWKNGFPFQIKLTPVLVTQGGLIAKPLENRILLQKSTGGSSNLLELTEKEYNRIKESIELKKKELMF